MSADRAQVSAYLQKHLSEFSGEMRFDEHLSRHTYYRIGGVCPWFAIPKGEDDILWLSRLISATAVPFTILGAGSNVLVSDQGFDGLVIKTNRLCGDCEVLLRHESHVKIRVGASVSVPVFLRTVASQGIGGFAFLSGVPGSMGGVVAMNAGTHLGEAASVIRSVTLISICNGQKRVVAGDALRFTYRKNHFIRDDELVLFAELEGVETDPVTAKAEIDNVLKRRKETQPLEYPSCGSVFKNPRDAGLHAWQVIDQLQLRGHRVGQAQFSEKHCNFIVNLGGATAADVDALIRLAQSRAQSELAIQLEEEVKRIGPFSLDRP